MQPNVHPSADNNFWFLRRGGREKIANQRGAKQRKRRQRHAQMTPCTKKNERAKQEKRFLKVWRTKSHHRQNEGFVAATIIIGRDFPAEGNDISRRYSQIVGPDYRKQNSKTPTTQPTEINNNKKKTPLCPPKKGPQKRAAENPLGINKRTRKTLPNSSDNRKQLHPNKTTIWRQSEEERR